MEREVVEVRLVGFPLALWQRSQEHVDELLREFALIAQGDEQRLSVPGRLLDLVAELTAAYGGFSAAAERERDEAIRMGLAETTLVYTVPADVCGAVRRLSEMLDEADEFCRAGGQLLTLQTPPDQLRFRRWFLDEFLAQLGGARPTPWPERLAATPPLDRPRG